ncbi:hypothetical protein HPB52_007555 [Rhipicephalus sanguineus]|uniref:Uncharacterized protein n=1 Tax=Rhipicephalus sanguineus TaxID=34632 RepID=A0A9D4T8U5_RHISA|nr:hypothetical protein HPB52_007555 [Rhipicephalus sanguineus]
MEDSTKVPLTPGSVINVPLGAKLEMQLKLPTESGSGIMVPAVCETDEGQTVMKKTTQSRTETQQSKRVATHGDQTVSESSQAVRKVMQDTRSMVHQSSTESNESQRIVKTTAQQSVTETKKETSQLPSGGSLLSTTTTVTNRSTSTSSGTTKKAPPPTAPKPKLKLNTELASDVARFGFPPDRPCSSASEASGQPAQQAGGSQDSPLLSPTGLLLLPKFYEPPAQNSTMDVHPLSLHRKKTFSSSSFYEEPNCIYPTVEEQVELARKIADSLSADTNRKSRGANMFFKRVKRSHKWVHEAPDYSDSEATLSGTETSREELATPDPATVPYKISKGPPKLKLILDPRHLQDANTLRSTGISIVEHNAISPEVCLDLVKDLNSPCGKGAAMFAKRKKKSEDWVVDVERVKAQLGDRWPEPHQPVAPIRTPIKTPVDRFKESLVNPRLRLVKSPWEAALESPIGSCEKAFAMVRPEEVVESVIRAAESKGVPEPAAYQNGLSGAYEPAAYEPRPFAAPYNPKDPCLARAPRGWRGTATQPAPEPSGGSWPSAGGSAAPSESVSPCPPLHTGGAVQPSALSPLPAFGSPAPSSINLSQFQNFNSLPRSWSPRCSSQASFRPVKAPTFYAR